MVAARNSEIEGLNRKFKATNTDPKLRRWMVVIIRQWLHEFRVATPQRMKGYKTIRRAVLSQMEIGIRNMFKGILSSKWKRAHERTLKKKYRHFVSGDSWASTISHALLQMSIHMWNTRCQIVHANSKGTAESVLRDELKKYCSKLRKEFWRLLPQDTHLVRRTDKFFDKAPISTVKMWKCRVNVAEKLGLKNETQYEQI